MSSTEWEGDRDLDEGEIGGAGDIGTTPVTTGEEVGGAVTTGGDVTGGGAAGGAGTGEPGAGDVGTGGTELAADGLGA